MVSAIDVSATSRVVATLPMQYIPVGLLSGEYYDAEGKPTAALQEFQDCVKQGLAAVQHEADKRELYPDCSR